MNDTRHSTISCARSFLFVPGERLDRLSKALACESHVVVIDLEDAVAPSNKDSARDDVRRIWPALTSEHRARIALRINGAETLWWDDDLALLNVLPGLAGAMLAKAERPAAMQLLTKRDPGLPLIPLIESAEGLNNIDLLARALGVVRFAFGHLDFQADLSMQCGPDEAELQPARMTLVLASRRARLAPPIDGVTVNLDDTERLQADTARSRRSGFLAKLCIHPRQISTVHRVFAPTAEQRSWAAAIMEAAAVQTAGAFRLEGQMIDAPMVALARSILEQ